MTLSNEGHEGVIIPHDDALVVSLNMEGISVKRVRIYTSSSANLLYYDALE